MSKKKVNKEFPEHVTWPATVKGVTQSPETDPLGSYTGFPTNPYEPPMQDADDL